MLRASASMSAPVCSAAATMFDCGALATMIPRLVAASTSTLSTPIPARPITRRFSARPMRSAGSFVAEGVRGGLRRRAEEDAVVSPDARRELLVGPVDADVDGETLAQHVHARVGD